MILRKEKKKIEFKTEIYSYSPGKSTTQQQTKFESAKKLEALLTSETAR